MKTLLSLIGPRVRSSLNSLTRGNRKNVWSRLVMFGGLGLLFWAGIFMIFYRVLLYFHSVQDFGDILAMKFVSMIILTFFMLLLFSNIINCLSHLYLSQDLPLLHSLPVSANDIFFSRWAISAFDSSWMILAFSLPVFLSYGIIFHTGIFYYAIFTTVMIFMCLIAAALSGILVLGRFTAAGDSHCMVHLSGISWRV